MSQQMDAEQLSDHALVERTLADPNTFRFLVQRYQAKLLRYIQRISGVSVQEAEDVLQETFISAYTHLRDVDPVISFSSWIYRIAHNTTISAYRKRKARPEGNMAWDMDDACVEQLIADTDIPAQTDRTLLRERVQAALAAIDLRHREMIELRFFQDKSYDEIADILRKPPGTVATLLHRAKQQLKKQLL